ncbi:MAG: (d)CMP kinase [Alphaproteobacteria bacterium]|jgi:CMP/dCMP kinase|nr:(d)CMP kinase [Alphaproteobacteria bacterium]
MIVAIDGPSASGKGTLSKRLAAHLGFAHLDTGKIYRAVGMMVVRGGGDPADESVALQAAKSLEPAILADPELGGDTAAVAASKVAAITSVRDVLLQFQRDFAAMPPDGLKGAVLDGRDIGTVVCPEAEVKLYVTASADIRAERRHKELLERGESSIYARVLQDMKERDERDTNRSVAPLKPAEDAFILDTSDLDADQAFAAALAEIERTGR